MSQKFSEYILDFVRSLTFVSIQFCNALPTSKNTIHIGQDSVSHVQAL